MVLLLRIVAVLFAIIALSGVALSLPWTDWLMEQNLAVLPEQQAAFEIVVFGHYLIGGIGRSLEMLVYEVSAALILLALARIIEQVEPGDGTAATADSPAAATSIWRRLTPARALRSAAAAVVFVWILYHVVPDLWFLWSGQVFGSQWEPDSAYFLARMARVTSSTVLCGAFVLVLLALAAILKRLDRVNTQPGGLQ